MTTDIRETLRGTALFEPLDSDGLDRFVDVGRVEYWPEGSSIVEQGENGPRMMVILEGQGKVSRLDANGVPRRIATLGPGDVVGEIALLLDMPRTATVEAVTDLRVFSMDRRAFQHMVDASDPAALRFGLELSRVLAHRLVQLNDVVVDLLRQDEGAEPLRQMFNEAREKIFTLWDCEEPSQISPG